MAALLPQAATSCAGQTARPIPPPAEGPVKELPGRAPGAADIHFAGFEFQRPYLGREGPGLWPIEGEPSKGVQYIVEPVLHGEEAVATAKFEAVDERGDVIQTLRVLREPDATGGSSFLGLMVVPDRPFQVAVSGEGVDGRPYRRVHERLFRPTAGPAAGPALPPGMDRATASRMRAMVEEATRQAVAKLEEDLKKRPGGVIVIPHTRVFNVRYAPLFSAAGRPFGVRVTYEAEFSEDGYYNPRLHVFPAYEQEDWRGQVEMRVLDGTIDPEPREAGSPQVRSSVLSFGDAGYLYRGRTTYRFAAEMVPDYVIRNEAKTKFCLYNQKFKHAHPKAGAAWAAILASGAPTNYRVYIGNSDFAGEIEGFYPQSLLYKSFVAEGAADCGEQPTTRF